MTAATIETPLVSQPDKGTIFLSRRSELRLIKSPRYPVRGPDGQKVGEKPGQAVAFSDGRFFCPSEGQVTLEDGRSADAAEIRGWLEQHRLLGDIEEGFWAVETKAPPVSLDELEVIANAGIDGDVETLERIIEAERAGWGREELIAKVQGSIERIYAQVENLQRQAEERTAEKPKQPRRQG